VYDRLTDRAREVLKFANQEANRFNHEYIGTEHLLLGLVKQGNGVAAEVLKRLDVDRPTIRAEVEKLIQSGPDMVTMGRLPMTPRAKHVLNYAIAESKELKHDYVGTEHILLGLIREDEGVAAQILMNLGLRLSQIREEVIRVLKAESESAGEKRIPTGKDDPPTETELRELGELFRKSPRDVQRSIMASRAARQLFEEARGPRLAMMMKRGLIRSIKALLWALPVAAAIGWFAESGAIFGLSLALIAMQNVIHHAVSDRRSRANC